MSEKITQRDVAKAAKVSTGTVSRVINNHPLVSASAKIAVQEAIKKLGYTPDTVAQSLAFGKSRNILVLFLDKQPILPSTWQYELPILQGINDFLTNHKYTLQIGMYPLGQRDFPSMFEAIIHKSSVAGLIVLTSWTIERKFLEMILKQGVPATFIGNGPYEIAGSPVGSTVLFDNFHVIKEVYTVLRSLGHTRIAFIKGTESQLHAQIRLKAFTEISRKYFPDMPDEYVSNGDYSVNAGFEGVYAFLKTEKPPTAIICANDLMAIGAMKAAAELGLRVPNDISIVGFDNIEVSDYLSPSLSTVMVPTYDLGVLGAQLLIDSIEQGKKQIEVSLPTTFLMRKSICKPSS